MTFDITTLSLNFVNIRDLNFYFFLFFYIYIYTYKIEKFINY